MHNCKLTRNVLVDLALGEMSTEETRGLLAELNNCHECHAEYTALTNTLRTSQQALRSAWLPAEDFWPDYRARLKDKIQRLQEDNSAASATVQPLRSSFGSLVWAQLRTLAATSVRVPLPAALALVLLAGIVFMSQRSSGQANITPSNPLVSVETRTVEVPVIQERVVTKVVYVEKKGRRSKGAAGSLDQADRNRIIARAGTGMAGKGALSLVGFKPTEQLKLTIIKGSYQDEK